MYYIKGKLKQKVKKKKRLFSPWSIINLFNINRSEKMKTALNFGIAASFT